MLALGPLRTCCPPTCAPLPPVRPPQASSTPATPSSSTCAGGFTGPRSSSCTCTPAVFQARLPLFTRCTNTVACSCASAPFSSFNLCHPQPSARPTATRSPQSAACPNRPPSLLASPVPTRCSLAVLGLAHPDPHHCAAYTQVRKVLLQPYLPTLPSFSPACLLPPRCPLTAHFPSRLRHGTYPQLLAVCGQLQLPQRRRVAAALPSSLAAAARPRNAPR